MFALISLADRIPYVNQWLWELPWSLVYEPPPQPGVTVPNPPPALPPGMSQKTDILISWCKGAVLVGGVAGLIYCAGQMVIGRKNRSSFAADGASGIPWVFGGLSLAATAAPIVMGVFGQ